MRTFSVIDAPQRSAEWFQARCGRLTGSRAKDMLASIQKGEAAARRDLRMQLVCERLTGLPQEDGFINADMQRGIDKEADAFAAYEALTGLMVERTGFLAHVEHMAGCSLDGHVGDYDGLIEIKVPRSANHYGYLKAGIVPPTHLPQILHNLWITGAGWCDFVSYDDRFPEHLRLFVARVPRVELEILVYEKTALRFLAEVEQEVAAVAALEVA